MLRLLLITIFLFSCASRERTKYQAFDKNQGGYRDKTIDEGIKMVNFKANPQTRPSVTKRFARFRAVEICQAENKKLAHFLDSSDKTTSSTITRTSTTGFPSYYYGMSPFYNRYSGFGWGLGFSTFDSRAWNETISYPEIEVIFECTNEIYQPMLELRQVSAEEMKHLVKDLRGALQVEKIPTASPNNNLRIGDIIIRGDGERIYEVYQLLTLFRKNEQHNITLDILRDGELKTGIVLKGVDVTEQMLQEQAQLVKKTCGYKELKDHQLCK
jgi:hypothetical protein